MRERQFRVGIAEPEPGDPLYGKVAPRLVISCTNCDSEETMNDEELGCDLGDLTTWAAGHRCSRPGTG